MKRDLTRRKFLQAASGAALASTFPDVLRVSAFERSPQQISARPRAVVFWEGGFPAAADCRITRDVLQQALLNFEVAYLTEQDLIARLNTERFDLLVTPYGSAFPKRAWLSLFHYLRGGGNWLNLGGVPLAVPVVRDGARWRAENTQTAYHKRLGITQSFPIKAGVIARYEPGGVFGARGSFESDFKAAEVYELYVRFTSTSDTPEESGSDGPREAMLCPLVFGVNQQQRRVAAPMIEIDRLQGDFAGGRWVLANFQGSIGAGAIGLLAERATEGAIQFQARSNFACYREGEIPSFYIQVRRPRGDLERIIRENCRIEVRDAENQTVSRLSVALEGKGTDLAAAARFEEITKLAPGFYNVKARLPLNSANNGSAYELTYATGFWVHDDAMMMSGKPLTVDGDFFYRDGEVYPVTGTTYMASDVHRQFLFEPNPFIWDRDFGEMKAAGVNMVRTGIWTGWKKYMPEAGKLNERALRALDAFLLTARKHDIPVIFTFFAFLPETWGGANAYLDQRAIQAQQQFVSTFAQRYRGVDDLIWDLINEPSFCSPKHLWSCRPNYDDHEKAAWQEWLKERYPYKSEQARVAALQQLWRTTSDDPVDLPRLEDFEGRNIFDARRPLKTLDYRLFAQEMFARWVRAMTVAIRSNGNQRQLITVGQDEAGLGDSPNPQFFAGTVDFTGLHNWWNNDDLVWDSAVAKASSKASLVEETGIMFYEKTDGSAWRTEEEARHLLERKMAISFGVDGAGFIEWIWNANCYINSDNEAAIGFHRVDQTAKPELEPFLVISKFLSTHRALLRGRQSHPMLMVIPHSQMFSPRNFATAATRQCVRAMYYHCRTPLRSVSEYKISESGVRAKLIVVPSPRVLSEKCWNALVQSAARGATVVISGILDADEHWLPIGRGERFGWTSETEPVSESESIVIAGRQYLVRYEEEKIQRIEKAVVQRPEKSLVNQGRLGAGRGGYRRDDQVRVLMHSHGAGRFIWSPLPLELGDSLQPLVAFYRSALLRAGITPVFRISPETPSILVLPSLFEKVALYTFVSEADRDTPLTLLHLETQSRVSLTVPSQRTALVLLDRRSGNLIASTVPTR